MSRLMHPQKYMILGLLMRGDLHGYALHRAFASGLDTVTYTGRSYVYSFLKQLEGEGKIALRREAQDNRPSRNVYSITPEGREDFLGWIKSPVERMRDLRIEFLAKLSLIKELGLPDAPGLIGKQVDVCQRLLETQKSRRDNCRGEFDGLIYDFRIYQLDAALKWLKRCRRQFSNEGGP